jgi:hypothetical protein
MRREKERRARELRGRQAGERGAGGVRGRGVGRGQQVGGERGGGEGGRGEEGELGVSFCFEPSEFRVGEEFECGCAEFTLWLEETHQDSHHI